MTKQNSKSRSKFRQKLINKYRLVILNEETFEERLSFKLTRLNVFVYGTLFSLLLITGTIYLIAFTSIREYIPGYSSSELKKKASALVYETDSLKQVMAVNDVYLAKIQELLTGKLSELKMNKDSILQTLQSDKDTFGLSPSNQEVDLRQDVESTDRFNIFNAATKKEDLLFFAPVRGIITDTFNAENKHYAIDIAVEKGTPVKAIAKGIVLFADWTPDTGNVIIIKHENGFTSVYKHNNTLTKEEGDLVESGEVIATAGNSGNLTTGTHLHFELWNDNSPINPTKYIDFE